MRFIISDYVSKLFVVRQLHSEVGPGLNRKEPLNGTGLHE